jgi:carbonic anhydrase
MYSFLRVFTIFFFLLVVVNVSYSQKTVTQTKESQAQIDQQKALDMLKEGNKRFVEGNELKRDYKEQIEVTAHGQYPYAIIICCMDSRVAPEIVLDQGIGDIFTIRVAGNVIDDDVLGGLEYACRVVGVKLIVVLGHTSCGAVKGACDDVKMGNLTQLVAKIKPAVDKTETKGERNSKNHEFVDDAAEHNVENQVDQLVNAKGTIVGDMIKDHEIGIVGGMYDVETGKVTFYAH